MFVARYFQISIDLQVFVTRLVQYISRKANADIYRTSVLVMSFSVLLSIVKAKCRTSKIVAPLQIRGCGVSAGRGSW